MLLLIIFRLLQEFFFRSKSIPTTILSATAVGEAFYVAKVYAELVYEISNMAISWRSLVALVSGGGIEVTVDREGRGERNAEFLFSLAIVSLVEPGMFMRLFVM